MSQQDDKSPLGSAGTDQIVANGSSDHDEEPTHDDFEDAIDPSSPRALTSKPVPEMETEASPNNEDDATADQTDAEGSSQIGSVAESAHSHTEDERPPSQSSDRISATSNLDNINLNDDNPLNSTTDTKVVSSKASPTDVAPERKLTFNNLTSALPSLPWSPPPASPLKSPALAGNTFPSQSAAASQAPPPSRKLTSPFSWLSRNSTTKDKETAPATYLPPRRNTASSITTIASNPEMMLSKLDELKESTAEDSDLAMKVTLRDRFTALRLRDEKISHDSIEDDQDANGRPQWIRKASSATGQSHDISIDTQPLKSPIPPPKEALAPGTVSGVDAGPSAMSESQVDWDLWHSVVYEGPAAVARTSAAELNRAIANGIPSAIRGVIWQVLSQSKNEDLEDVYQGLIVKGTDKEKDRRSNSTTGSQLSIGKLSTHTGELVSVGSNSSIHSDHSGSVQWPTSPLKAGKAMSSPFGEQSEETITKAHIAAANERKQRAKDDNAALQKLEKTIRRDLGARTSFSKYAAAAGLQEGLFGVCKAYALFDEGVGYAQGMNFLIMPLLFNMPEEEAFSLLVRLMNHYQLRDFFVQDMPGLHMRLYQFERLLEDIEPALYCHLHRRGISPHLYATQWFLTLFAYRFPLQLVLRIYDLIFSEGTSAILRFGIALLQKNVTKLLEISDMQQLTTYLKDKLFDAYIDRDPSQGSLLESGFFGSSAASIDKEVYRADQFVRDACEIKLSPEMLKIYTSEWEEKTKLEKSRETELLDLRATNRKYAIQVRKLEERIEVCDREQAELATDLVHTKVENQDLKDENESLKGQVGELRVVIEKQPLEIEEAWKLERDDLMKRNVKVHEENEGLEKELADMAEQLVQTKMKYAEINSQYETLNRKWADMKRQFA